MKSTRTSFFIPLWQREALRARARREGRSMSEIVREILGRHLERKQAGPRNGEPRYAELVRRLDAIDVSVGGDEDIDRVLYGKP